MCEIIFFFFFLLLIQGSKSMSQILVQKLGALAHVSPHLKSRNPSVQKATMSLLGNLSRNICVQTSMGKVKFETLTHVQSTLK